MKSAYELAMERLEESSGPARKLSDEQKARIADIENKFDAKTAEEKLAFDQELAAAESLEDVNSLRARLAEQLATLEEKRDKEKGAVWGET